MNRSRYSGTCETPDGLPMAVLKLSVLFARCNVQKGDVLIKRTLEINKRLGAAAQDFNSSVLEAEAGGAP